MLTEQGSKKCEVEGCIRSESRWGLCDTHCFIYLERWKMDPADG